MADEGLPDSPPFLSPQLRLRRLVFLDSAPASPEAIDQTFAPIRQLHGHVHELTHQFSDILRDVGAVPRFSGRSRRTRQPRHNVSNFRLIIPDERIQQPGHFQRNRIFASPFPLHPPPPPGHESWPRPLPEPIVKVATALPKVSYKENQDEYRTLDYIQAQLKVLGHLKNTPADNLTAPMAASFIRRIKPDDGTPTALQALQLCYYMRSLGFDTYALWDQAWGELKFYVAASLTNPLDLLFWHQNIKTNAVISAQERYVRAVREMINNPPRRRPYDFFVETAENRRSILLGYYAGMLESDRIVHQHPELEWYLGVIAVVSEAHLYASLENRHWSTVGVPEEENRVTFAPGRGRPPVSWGRILRSSRESSVEVSPDEDQNDDDLEDYGDDDDDDEDETDSEQYVGGSARNVGNVPRPRRPSTSSIEGRLRGLLDDDGDPDQIMALFEELDQAQAAQETTTTTNNNNESDAPPPPQPQPQPSSTNQVPPPPAPPQPPHEEDSIGEAMNE